MIEVMDMNDLCYEEFLKDAETYVNDVEETVLDTMLKVCLIAQYEGVMDKLKYIDTHRTSLGIVGTLAEMYIMVLMESNSFAKAKEVIINALSVTPDDNSKYLGAIVFLGLREMFAPNDSNQLIMRKMMLSAIPLDKVHNVEKKLDLMRGGVEYAEITEDMVYNHKLVCFKEDPIEELEEKDFFVELEKSETDTEEVEGNFFDEPKVDEFFSELNKKEYGNGDEVAEAFRRVSKRVTEDEWKRLSDKPFVTAYWLLYCTPETRSRILETFSDEVKKAMKWQCETIVGRDDFEMKAEENLLAFFKTYNEMKYGFSSL